MFCDKDPAQISAIATTWGEHTIRLCLWHLNRAVDKKLATKRGRLGHMQKPLTQNLISWTHSFFFISTTTTMKPMSSFVQQQEEKRLKL
jgi:hypothetical protein